MPREYFMRSERVGFSRWGEGDLPLAERLWGDPDVSRYICASGVFTPAEIEERLSKEILNGQALGIQYWPLFELSSGRFMGCCGLRPHGEGCLEMGIHLLPAFWRRGFAFEACTAVIGYAFGALKAEKLFAGHNPKNAASRGLLKKLGFSYTGDEFYAPTGLYHPSYELYPPVSLEGTGQETIAKDKDLVNKNRKGTTMENCIFCKLASGEIPTNVVYEDESVFSFYDADPQAPVHVLIIPKKHLGSLNEASCEDAELLAHMLLKAKDIAAELGLENGYRLVINTGADGGQSVPHLHIHLLGKRQMNWPPGD